MTNDLLFRAASLIPGSDAGSRIASVIFVTSLPVDRIDLFGQRYREVLSLDAGHIRLDRLNNGAPLLNAHRADAIDDVIGVVESARVERGQGIATLRFAKDPVADAVLEKVRDKIIRNVSVGYRIHTFTETPGDAGQTPVRTAIDWEPYEISIVPIGADANAHFRAAQPLEEHMTETPDLTTPEQTERQRASDIINAVRVANLDTGFAADLISRGVTIDAARSAVFAELARRDAGRAPYQNHLRVGEDAGLTRRALVAEALAARLGGPAPSDAAREFVHMRIPDVARESLDARGVSTRGLNAAQLVTRALHTTSDFPSLLTEAGSRVLRHAYESYAGGLKRICRESTAPDFRAKSRLMLGEGPALVKVLEHGEVTRGTMTESKSSYALATYARIFGITRHALVNDDLGAFGDMTVRLGRSSAEFVASQLAALLTTNPPMPDNDPLFHANHDNLGSAAAISITSLTEALKMMRLQTGLDGTTVVDVTPKYLIVPAALEVIAKQYVAAITAAKSSDANPFTASLDIVVDPRLDAVSATAWYLAADANAIDTIEYAYLESEPGPVIESRAGFDVEGVQFKVRLDFGSGILDHRGLFKNAGA